LRREIHGIPIILHEGKQMQSAANWSE
jgi:hypothetical protein